MNNKGFIKAVVLIIIVLVILGFLGYSVRDIVGSPKVSDNLSYAWDLVRRACDFLVGLLPDRGVLPATPHMTQ